ncbi:HNH endonuclease [Pseudomonas uvaldensis]|uniref:HNH endonuclease n=1 Tax=Pseudomonas uvaldensis TaxID=2878385 RepID=UPI001E48AED1|nr:HNH endonuclease [Pseudomonas uvaldensis]MCE0461275.1 HNH endonuclease [Pseudomonas uvaldensis]
MDTELEALRPKGKWMIIDCVEEAGIDVSAWSFRKKDGQPVALPQSNGGYCYEWSFRNYNERIFLLCVWFEELRVDDRGRVHFSGNLASYADTLIRQLEKAPKNRSRTIKDPRISRAQHFNSTVQLAYMNSVPVRVVIVSGPVREIEDIDSGNDRAVGRYLDSESWTVERFDKDTGDIVLVRGWISDQPLGTAGCEGEDAAGLAIADGQVMCDQFREGNRSEAYTYNGVQRYRDPKVRALVLARSGGTCELTSAPGFKMANGGIYLETHHIVPLSEGGADAIENVIALSADAHRRAHYAVDREDLRRQCLEIVAERMRSL